MCICMYIFICLYTLGCLCVCAMRVWVFQWFLIWRRDCSTHHISHSFPKRMLFIFLFMYIYIHVYTHTRMQICIHAAVCVHFAGPRVWISMIIKWGIKIKQIVENKIVSWFVLAYLIAWNWETQSQFSTFPLEGIKTNDAGISPEYRLHHMFLYVLIYGWLNFLTFFEYI